MTRKFIIVFAITALFTALVAAFSWLFLSQLLRQRLLWADETASQLTNQLEYAAAKAVPDLTSTRIDTANPKAMRAAIANYLQTDTDLNEMLESVVGNSSIIYDAAIVDPNGVAADHGFQVGDVILDVGGKSVANPGDVRKQLADARKEGKRALLFRVKSGEGTRFVALPLNNA